jgi:RNA recognition motif-containing protein
MNNTKLYVTNLAAATTEEDLMNLFSSYGNVAEAHVSHDALDGQTRTFGSVTMATPHGAQSAILGLNGKTIGPGILAVSEVRPPGGGAGAPTGPRTPRRSPSCLY